MKRLIALSWLIAALAPLSAAAQVKPPLGESASDYRFKIGPVGLAPTFLIQNLGVDSNATLDAEKPSRDFTFRMTPGAAYLLPMRRMRLYGTTSISYQYWQKTASQRSVDTLNQAALSITGNRFVPRVFGTYGRQRNRPTLEIEAMVGQLTQGIGVGTDIRFSPRFVIQLEGEQTRQNFEDRLFRGAKLDTQLNRTTQTVRASARVAVTPITSLVFSGVNTRERFGFVSGRDAESLSLLAGMQTKPSALIAGNASVGYRRFNPLNPDVPDYRGVVADISMSYTLLDRTRLAVTGSRGLEFSAEVVSPYYVLTSGGVSITQMLGHGWDVQVGAGGDTLAYRSFIDLATSVPASRRDHVDSVSGGFGFRVGDTGRMGLEVSRVVRRSPIPLFSYEGWRAGVKVTYGT